MSTPMPMPAPAPILAPSVADRAGQPLPKSRDGGAPIRRTTQAAPAAKGRADRSTERPARRAPRGLRWPPAEAWVGSVMSRGGRLLRTSAPGDAWVPNPNPPPASSCVACDVAGAVGSSEFGGKCKVRPSDVGAPDTYYELVLE